MIWYVIKMHNGLEKETLVVDVMKCEVFVIFYCMCDLLYQTVFFVLHK